MRASNQLLPIPVGLAYAQADMTVDRASDLPLHYIFVMFDS